MKMQIKTSTTLSQLSTTKSAREREWQREKKETKQENTWKHLTIFWGAWEPRQALYNRESNPLWGWCFEVRSEQKYWLYFHHSSLNCTVLTGFIMYGVEIKPSPRTVEVACSAISKHDSHDVQSELRMNFKQEIKHIPSALLLQMKGQILTNACIISQSPLKTKETTGSLKWGVHSITV